MLQIRTIFAAAMAIFSSVACALAAGGDDITREKFPDADSVLVDGMEDIVYNPDGTYRSVSSEKIKILTEKGRREESVIEMGYSARYGRAKILEVKVEGEDGSERRVDVAANTKETTDNSSEGENIYDPMHKKIVCNIPGLKIGDTVVYSTMRETFASRIKDQWADVSVFEWSAPMLKRRVRITSPAQRPLKKIAIRNPLGNIEENVFTNGSGSIVREWSMEGSAQVFPEPDMPPLHTQVQNLRVSTAGDWKEISRWYWSVSKPHLDKVNEAISNKVEEIGHDMAAIYKWVAQEIRYMGLTMEAESPGYAPHDVDITFANRYGVCRDKGALLVAMLRIAGFKAYPVLIHAGEKMDAEVPMPYFNHAVAAVEKDGGGYILLDPTDESSRDMMPAYLSNKSYLVARPEGETLLVSPVPDARSNSVTVKSDATLDKDGAMLLESTVSFSGINDNIYRYSLLRLKKDARRKFFEKRLNALAPGAELLDFELKPSELQDTATPLEARLVAKIPDALIEGGTRSEFAVPFVSRVFGSMNWILSGKTSLERRKYPLVLSSTAMVDETLTVRVEDSSGRVLEMPQDVDIDGEWEYHRSFRLGEDGVFTAKRLAAVNTVEFSPETYSSVRESIKKMEAAERERPVFAKTRFRGANIRVFDDETRVHIASRGEWVVTNTITEKILSYDGKKKYSELKFDYNPTWKNVELLYATVSNSDGRVSAVTDREKNVFDASWAASARRYPATKRLIVNLPGVEIGSVVSYSYVTTVTNAPAPFYGKWSFDSAEPVDRVALWVDGEKVKEAVMPEVIVSEPLMADGELWQNMAVVSRCDWESAARNLRKAARVGAYGDSGARPWGNTLRSIRDWMAMNVKIVGPSLYETPLDAQMTSPATVVKERYASRLDYIRTLCALLKGAGFDADVVFASLDASEPEAVRRRDMEESPNVRAFAYPIVRVRETKGGWLWFGGEETVTYIGTENQYAPLGATVYEGSHFFDPESGEFGVAGLSDASMHPSSTENLTFTIRENGAVDLDVESELYGPGVASFRKKYAEMLPEDRARHYQGLLGDFAQAASATRDLVTDTEGYPARLGFSAYIPGYAVVNGDAATITLSSFLDQMFPLSAGRRRYPIGVGAVDDETVNVTIVFPEGYTIAEHLPESFVFANPLDGGTSVYEGRTSSEVVDGRLVVKVSRFRPKSGYLVFGPGYAQLLRDWSRTASSRSNRTFIARKGGK